VTLLSVTIALRVLFLIANGLIRGVEFYSDDALITLRYSFNLAQGRGFVYNPGEHVLGTTTPLYTLVMSIPALLKLDLLWSSVITNSLIDCGSVIVIRRILSNCVRSALVRLPLILLFAANPVIIRWSCYGMEVSLLVFLSLLTAYWFWQGRYWASGISAAFVVLTRIDGVIFVGSLAIAHLIVCVLIARRFFVPWKMIVAFSAGFAPWAIFALLTFGSIIPQSIVAKQLAYHWVQIPLIKILDLGWGFSTIPLYVVGCYSIMRRIRTGEVVYAVGLTYLLWAIALAIFFVITRAPAHIYEWYRVPFFTSVAVVGMIGLRMLGSQLKEAFSRLRPRQRVYELLNVTVLVLAPLFIFYARPLLDLLPGQQPQTETSMHLAVGQWLRKNASSDATVIAGNIGFIGYFSQLRVLDDVGLVSPEVLPFLANSHGDSAPLIDVFRPDYLALEWREVVTMQAEITRLQCAKTFEVGVAFPSVSSPYQIYRCPWAK